MILELTVNYMSPLPVRSMLGTANGDHYRESPCLEEKERAFFLPGFFSVAMMGSSWAGLSTIQESSGGSHTSALRDLQQISFSIEWLVACFCNSHILYWEVRTSALQGPSLIFLNSFVALFLSVSWVLATFCSCYLYYALHFSSTLIKLNIFYIISNYLQ